MNFPQDFTRQAEQTFMAGSAHSIGLKLIRAWLFANTLPHFWSEVDRATPAVDAHAAAEAKGGTLNRHH